MILTNYRCVKFQAGLMSGFEAILVSDGRTDGQAWVYTTLPAKAKGSKKLWGQTIMQYLNPIYTILHLFGHKSLIQLKDFIYYRKDYKILKIFGKAALENFIFISKSLKWLLASILKQLFHFFLIFLIFLSLTLMILHEQTLVILKTLLLN